MSYDLYAIRPPTGATAAEIAQLALDSAEAELPDEERSSDAADFVRVLVKAVCDADPALQQFVFDHAKIAGVSNISVASAQRRYRHVELNGSEEGNGIQVTVHDSWASITVPYWHSGTNAAATWREILDIARAMIKFGNVTIYDPQLDRVLDVAKDQAAILTKYAEGVAFTANVGADKSSASRPWWR